MLVVEMVNTRCRVYVTDKRTKATDEVKYSQAKYKNVLFLSLLCYKIYVTSYERKSGGLLGEKLTLNGLN